MSDTASLASKGEISLSDSAAKRLAWLIEQEADQDLMLRISVNGGGCSGFTYSFSFDKEVKGDDLTFQKDGVTAVIDEMSLEFLDGSVVDYVEGIAGAAFQISNPNATSSWSGAASSGSASSVAGWPSDRSRTSRFPGRLAAPLPFRA